jgi:hypothetical protein
MDLTENGNSEAGHDVTSGGEKRKLRVRVPRWELADDKA